MGADTTKASLIAAAEELFAAEGIDAVSLRGINRASGVKNALAVQYHFGDRAGVLSAILEKHRPEVEARRHAMLDEYEAAGDVGARALAAALVRPLAAKLSDLDGGPAYLAIYAELLNRPTPPVEPLASLPNSSIGRWRSLAAPVLTGSPKGHPRGLNALRFAAAELGRRAAKTRRRDDRLFISQLIDLIAAMIDAPASEETKRLSAKSP